MGVNFTKLKISSWKFTSGYILTIPFTTLKMVGLRLALAVLPIERGFKNSKKLDIKILKFEISSSIMPYKYIFNFSSLVYFSSLRMVRMRKEKAGPGIIKSGLPDCNILLVNSTMLLFLNPEKNAMIFLTKVF